MTVLTNKYYIEYVGDGATTEFAYDFKVFLAEDMTVTLDDVVTLAYTIDGLGDDNGGTIKFNDAPANGAAILIKRVLDLTQPVDYNPYDPFPAETHERALDRIVMMVQQAVIADNLYAPYVHYHKATDSSYDNTQTNLGADNVQEAIDAVYGLANITAILYRDITDDAGDGTPEGDLNATDFTAQSGTTSQPIDETTAYIFYHKDSIYNWVGPRSTSVGVGGATTAVAVHLHVGITSIAAAVSYDNSSSELTAINVQTALDEIVATDAGAITGYKNVLINPWFAINQRGNTSDWDTLADGEYREDRWRRNSTTEKKQQLIEPDNLRAGYTYTLTWQGSGTGTIYFNSGVTISGNSGIKLEASTLGAAPYVEIPYASTFAQFERGDKYTGPEIRPISLERSLCLHYYVNMQLNSGNASMPYYPSGGMRVFYVWFPVQMRVAPDIKGEYWSGGVPEAPSSISTRGYKARCNIGDDASAVDWQGAYIDAELT